MSFYQRMQLKICCVACALALTASALAGFAPSARALESNSPVAMSSIQSKKVTDVISKDGALTGYLAASKDETLPSGDQMTTLSSYAQLLLLLNKQERLFEPPSVVPAADGVEVIATPDTSIVVAKTDGPDYSVTNVRTPGIDEPDLIKTDGRYIYSVNDNNTVSIVDADTMKVVKTIKTAANENFVGILLSGSKLVVIGERYYGASEAKAYLRYNTYASYYVYDVSNAANAAWQRTVRLNGNHAECRLLNNTLYAVSRIWAPYYQASLPNILPAYFDSAVGSDFFAVAPGSIRCFPDETFYYYTNIATFSLNSNTPAVVQTELSESTSVYMSANALYIVHDRYGGDSDRSSRISRYSLQGGALRHTGAAGVRGRVLNDYSVDEYDGYLRVATTDSGGNHLIVLDGSLKTVGSINGLAKGESIQSVRFMGKAGYMVTYRQTDPLFALDLSSPTNPRVTGQLKVPGFSSYLHPFGTKYLVGIGRDTAETFYIDSKGKRVPTGGAVDQGLKMSLFDVSSPTKPREVTKTILGKSGTWSPGENNPRALLVDTNLGLIAMPIMYNDGDADVWSGGIVMDIQPKGITAKAKLKLLTKESELYNFYDSRFCRIGSKLYFSVRNSIWAYDYDTFKELGSVQLGNP